MAAAAVSQRVAPFVPNYGLVFSHQTSSGGSLYNRVATTVNGKSIYIEEVLGIAFIEVNERLNAGIQTVVVNDISIMGRVKEKFCGVKCRKPRLRGEEGVEEGEYVMAGSPFKERENGQVMVREVRQGMF